MKTIELLGTVQGAVDGALSILRPNGREVVVDAEALAGAGVTAIKVLDQAAAQKVAASIGHLAGTGTLRDALKAHCPHLPDKSLAIVLTLADELTAAVDLDGDVSLADLAQILMSLAKEILSK